MSVLKGKRGLILGALDERSIAWQVALKAKEAGANIVLSNTPAAIRMSPDLKELALQTDSLLIPADATNINDLEVLWKEAMSTLGGQIDFVLHAVGMSPNLRKSKSYTDIDYNYYQKTLDISAISFHKLLQTAWQMDALSERASVLALSFIAAQRYFPEYGDMSEAKAALESIARNFGFQYGKRKGVRVNTVSQSPTKTTAGSGIKGFDELFEYSDKLSPLGNAPAEACADLCVMLFSDACRYLTMQNIYHDGGFSSVGFANE